LLFGRPELLATPLVSVLVQYSRQRNHLFPTVPAMGEFGRTEEEKKILQLYGSTAELGRALMAPPGVPEARLKILREAFNAMMKDPEFIADTKKSKMEIDALDATGVAKVVEETINVPPAIAQAVAEAVKQ
jgi:tripartite-type tricarboxylate transporter receptor subunit TctC